MIFDQYDIVVVPFPFTDKKTNKRRPALVISNPGYQTLNQHCILTMITSAQHSSWAGDIEIKSLTPTGLTSPSLIRFKIFTLDQRLILHKLGKLGNGEISLVEATLDEYL